MFPPRPSLPGAMTIKPNNEKGCDPYGRSAGLVRSNASLRLELIRSPGQLVKDYALSDSIAQAS